MLVAAGSGTRAGGDRPKQYREIAGRSVIARAADALLLHPAVATVVAVIGSDQRRMAEAMLGSRPVRLIAGGAERAISVANGLAALEPSAGDAIVMIHDAARPFLPPAVIDRLLAALDGADGAVPVLPVTDTLARSNGALGDTVPRDHLVRVQTPQAFRLGAIRAAHRCWTGTSATDDAQVARAAGLSVAMVAGDPALEKLTVNADFARAEALLSARMVTRTGLGFDVHAFCPGDHLWLGGIRIPHDRGLAGHSDADVVLHAIVDALLGAIANGDIGQHFPPNDPQWKGAASSRFAEHVRALVEVRGGVIDHVDVTVICEHPKVGPHRDAIRTNVAAVLRLPESRVSIKATTTELLGFTGRGEGMAAQAVATVRLPIDKE